MKAALQVAPPSETLPRPSARAAALDRAVLIGSFILLLFGPLAFGAVEPWSIAVLEVGAAVLFLLWTLRQTLSGEIRVTGNPLFPPMVAFAALVAVQLVFGLTAYRQATWHSALLYVAYGLICFLVVQSLRETARLAGLARVICVYGSALAAFALFYGLSTNGKLYWLRVPRSGGWIYGPYVNHNHYAGLMETLLPVPLVLALGSLVEGPARKLAAVAAAVMAVTIFLSGSRGGMAAFTVQIAVLAAVLVRRRKNRATALVLGTFLAAVAISAGWIGGGELTSRLASIQRETQSELSQGTRLAIVRDGLKMFRDRPLVGWGLGAFPDVYPRYRSFYTNSFVNQAHDDFLQLLVETGALGFAIMLWLIAVTLTRGARKLGNWPADPNGSLSLVGVLACTGILVHSLVDFNLQIPANAAWFYVLCVLTAMEPRFALLPFRRRSGQDTLQRRRATDI